MNKITNYIDLADIKKEISEELKKVQEAKFDNWENENLDIEEKFYTKILLMLENTEADDCIKKEFVFFTYGIASFYSWEKKTQKIIEISKMIKII